MVKSEKQIEFCLCILTIFCGINISFAEAVVMFLGNLNNSYHIYFTPIWCSFSRKQGMGQVKLQMYTSLTKPFVK